MTDSKVTAGRIVKSQWLARLEDGAAELTRLVVGRVEAHKGFAILWFVNALLLALALIWLPVYTEFAYFGWLKAASLVFCGAPFVLVLLIALNLKKAEDKKTELAVDEATEEIDTIASDLANANAKVAALDFPSVHLSTDTYISENLLRDFDDVMMPKAAVVSLGRVIESRQRIVADRLNHIKEVQQRARRATTAAGGGVFLGFTTYEVGESVLKYGHMVECMDDHSFNYWLYHTTTPKPAEAHTETHTEVHSETCITESKAMPDMHHAELVGHATLLTITLVVSLLAAAVGWRKPAEEQAGESGNGGE